MEVLLLSLYHIQKKEQIKEISVIENYAKNKSGSGSAAAQLLVYNGIDVLISGKMDPVAFQILKNACIKVYKITPGNVGKNLNHFNEGKLEEVTSLSSGFPP